MIKISKADNNSILNQVREGNIDAVSLSTSSLIDDIILAMHKNGITHCIKNGFQDKRVDNTTVPFDLTLLLAIAAKMKVNSSLTDIPFAITDHRTLCELGYSMLDTNGDIKTGLMREGTIRALLGKYTHSDFIDGYNNTVQNHILSKTNISSNIHILDCTEIEVNYPNKNFEGSEVVRGDDGNYIRGYKLATIRGIVGDTGVIEDIRFGAINIHDLNLSRDMLMNTQVFKEGDILINDRGFISRELLNYLKSERKIDTYIPLKTNMEAYKVAVEVAKEEKNWLIHPNKKRKNQKISFVSDLGAHWISSDPKTDVPINACVVWDKSDDKYFVFVTTDTSRTEKQIIQTYELRPEIEEDYRQLKDFWKLEDFKSTKLNTIAFHIVCVLLGYLFFQLYTMLPEGEIYQHKSLPIILKNYEPKVKGYLVLYSGDVFGVLTLIEFAELYSSCDDRVKKKIGNILEPN